ncbi:hypothetical protein BX600DRAFT_442192 [Xylariales sp. PMI_506]|nr:hypothetical protein BX600DRAFT_442192 [Xylariales sp. PMI_506]
MAKKNRQPAASLGEGPDATGSTTTAAPASNSGAQITAPPNSGAKKAGSSSAPSQTSPSPSSPLVICRNKHWRYISSFHGPWLQLPLEVLETLANANYYMPLPRPVDPAVFYDLVKIRNLVDGATDLAVRAANGVTSSAMSNSLVGGTAQQMQALGLGFGGGGGMKLSPERRFRLREQATQKLSRAYHIDEIASSVATMQSTSTLENVAGLVLQRSASDPDANYVHFFHEKIPSRQLAECTDFRALDLIIGQRHADCEPLRTRAIVRMFKEDFEGAAQDLTQALAVYRLHNQMAHPPSYESMQLERRSARRRDMPTLDERDQPSSTEVQLLFQRAGCYLTLACDHVAASLPKRPSHHKNGATSGAAVNGNSKSAETTAASGTISSLEAVLAGTSLEENGPTKKELENRKAVRLYAKRALRDYMEYLKPLHYSPNLPIDISDDFTRQVNQASQRSRRYQGRSGSNQDPSSPVAGGNSHTVHSLNELFSATPPADLPAYPSNAIVAANASEPTETTMESVTYHPLLTDALHSLLLCHALIQTSAKELQRHAHMVSRLARLADGYPIFQASRSPARADWIEVLRRAENWIELSSSWESLCAPAPLPTAMGPYDALSPAHATANALAITGGASPTETEEQRKDRLKHQAILEALEDERVNDEASFKAAILARQSRAEADLSQSPRVGGSAANSGVSSPSIPTQKRWAVDDGREYPILTERAEAVARWVREAPAGSGVGTSKRKKKPGASKKPALPAAASHSSEDLGTAAQQQG